MNPQPKVDQLVESTSAFFGTVLAHIFGAMGRIRPTPKPLHPRGDLRNATVVRTGCSVPVGVPWIDEPGTDTVQVRLSRATGLPPPLPDFHGLALRIPVDADYADVLFATTGLGTVSRFVLLLARGPMDRAYSTVIPYETTSGPLLLAAIPNGDSETEFSLACAPMVGAWRNFGRLRIVADQTDVPTGDSVSFDPIINQLPRLRYYPWATALREGAYRAARRSRGN